MAQFDLNWNNNNIQNSVNNTTQKALYRQKTVGGAWLDGGFTPVNPLPKTASTVKSPLLTDNVVYEFKVDCDCTSNGPVSNANGVQEQIGFAAINPTLSATGDSATITIDLANTDITKAQFTLRKLTGNAIAFGPYVGNKVAGVTTALATGLDPATDYYWQVILFASVGGLEINSSIPSQNNAPYGPYGTTTGPAPVQNLMWVADQTVCEKEGGFSINKTINGLSSPVTSWHDATNNRVYVADSDSPKGNVYWFNPDTATTEADMTYSNAIVQGNLYSAYIDGEKRKIYFVGANTGGLLVYDIDTNTSSVVEFGLDGAFNRITLAVGEDYIYCNDRTVSLIVINRHTLTTLPTVTIATMPFAEHFTLDTQLVPAANKVYVINAYNGTAKDIGVYSADLSTHIAEIVLPGAAVWASMSAYWQTGYFDKSSGRVYVGDIGSSSRHVIDTTTDTVIHSSVVGNTSGKSNVRSSWTVNPVTNELMYLFAALNSTSDSAEVRRTYVEDRATHNLTKMFETQAYNGLAQIKGTNKLVGTNPAGVSWNGTVGWGSDGVIQILDNSTTGMNTGKKITVTLKQVDANNNNAPTGLTKDNLTSDPNYIAPTTDTATCVITYSTECPVDLVSTFGDVAGKLEWEFSIANAVRTNPSIAKISVYAYNTGTASVEGIPIEFNSPLTSNYYKGSFTGLSGLNYTIKIKYFNASGVELQNC